MPKTDKLPDALALLNANKLHEALSLLGIVAEQTGEPGQTAWYTASGEYLGTHGVDDGLAHLRDIVERVRRLK